MVTDARCYQYNRYLRGIQDNKIGKILGVDDNTGAGGANVFTYDLLRVILSGSDSLFEGIPNCASMRVAVRQTTRRVGDKAGLPLENLGIQPDAIHRMIFYTATATVTLFQLQSHCYFNLVLHTIYKFLSLSNK